jgi:cytochrome c biogenesis protein CcmG/thiol:disulfide interchange protein DsbE
MPVTRVRIGRGIAAAAVLVSTLPWGPSALLSAHWGPQGQSQQAAPAPAGPATTEGCTTKVVPAKLNFTMKDLDDKKVKLADFKGKIIVLNFWATWCVPCKTEIPEFVELQKQYEAQGVQFIGVSVDDTPALLRPYVEAQAMNYPVLQGKGHDEVLDAYGPIKSLPMTYVIRRDGTFCKRHAGPVERDVLERELKTLF